MNTLYRVKYYDRIKKQYVISCVENSDELISKLNEILSNNDYEFHYVDTPIAYHSSFAVAGGYFYE